MTSGIHLFAVERGYITVTQGKLSHGMVADHLSYTYGIPRTRKGVIDYCHRTRVAGVVS